MQVNPQCKRALLYGRQVHGWPLTAELQLTGCCCCCCSCFFSSLSFFLPMADGWCYVLRLTQLW